MSQSKSRSRSRLFSKNGRVLVMKRYGPGPVPDGTGQVPDRYRSVCQERKNYCTIPVIIKKKYYFEQFYKVALTWIMLIEPMIFYMIPFHFFFDRLKLFIFSRSCFIYYYTSSQLYLIFLNKITCAANFHYYSFFEINKSIFLLVK